VRARTITTLAAAALGLSATPAADAAVPPPVRAETGAATNVLTTSALLTGSIEATEPGVRYYFRWGPTKVLGFQTATGIDTKPGQRVKVGEAISGLQPGTVYYYKLVTVLPNGTHVEGFEARFPTKSTPNTFVAPHIEHATYGVPFLLSGDLLGTGNAGVEVTLQASAFPYLESFTPIGPPAMTTRGGAFSFRVANLKVSTQLRLMAQTLLPVFSPIINVTVQPRVILHVRSSSQKGLDRLYGTISPSVRGAKVLLQVQKATRPQGLSEVTERWATQFATETKKGAGNSSRFSVIAKIKHKGRYRAFIQLPTGGRLVSGASTMTFVLAAAT